MPIPIATQKARLEATMASFMPLFVQAYTAVKAEGKRKDFRTLPWYENGQEPKDGEESVAPNLDRKAAGRMSLNEIADKIGARGLIPSRFVSQIQVHQYESPEGDGFFVEATIENSRMRQRYTLVHGPAQWKAGWTEVAENV